MTDLVQAIAVLKNVGTHEEVVRAVARASAGAYIAGKGTPIWDEWLSGAFTKSVRRGTQAQFDALRPLARCAGKVGDVMVLAFDPMRYEDFPPALTKMQVSNYERPRDASPPYKRRPLILTPRVWVNASLGMSTGKTAAQVAHGIMAWCIKWGIEEYNPFKYHEVYSPSFDSLICDSDIIIRDAGKTEIDPGSVTVLVSCENRV